MFTTLNHTEVILNTAISTLDKVLTHPISNFTNTLIKGVLLDYATKLDLSEDQLKYINSELNLLEIKDLSTLIEAIFQVRDKLKLEECPNHILIETFNSKWPTIVTDEEGQPIIFNNIEEAEEECKDLQEGIIVSY